jgi:hypothetical protein
MPGIIDTENGMIHRMPFYDDVKDLPLGEFWPTIPASGLYSA